MSVEFRPFHSFPDAELVNDFAAKLEDAGIEYKIEKIPALVSDFIIGSTPESDISINLRSKDFEKAHKVLGDYYKTQLDLVDKDHYLFSFTDQELYEILEKPDEWGYLDYQLTQKILKERGKSIDNNTLLKINASRKAALAEPAYANTSFYIVGYFFIAYGIYSSVFPDTLINLVPYIFLTPFFSIVIGHFLFRSRKILPDGERVFVYRKEDRRRGMIMMYIGLAVFAVRMVIYVSFSF